LKRYSTEADLITDGGLLYTKLAGGDGMNKKELGSAGEDFAENYLALDKYGILKKNYRTRFGEIDIIALKGRTVYFFEVKTRRSSAYGYAEEAVGRVKRKRILGTALRFISENKALGGYNMAFMLIAIQISGGDISIKMVPMN